MRLRKIKNASEKLQADSTYFVSNPLEHQGKWNLLFENDHPLHIEIGCGKGKFISELAALHPEINYVAIEKYDSVLLRCLEKVSTLSLPNLRLTIIDASKIQDYFAVGEVNQIYLNFSDPWPKKCHAKRRLTSSSFLNQYDKILEDSGAIFQKTDNRHFFEYSLESFNSAGWQLSNISLDLHQDIEIENITTEFEDKWSLKGPIYRLEARKKKQ